MYFVYITTNKAKSVLYTGVTNNLENRLIQHFLNRGNFGTFAGRYSCYNQLHFEEYYNIIDAIKREKEIKNRPRNWKEALISLTNPGWIFLNKTVLGKWPPLNISL